MKNLVFIKLCLLLSGCASVAPVTNVKDNHDVTALLSKAASKAAAAQQQLALIEQARAPATHADHVDVNTLPTELKTPLSLTWQGPIEAVIDKIAVKIGYKVTTLGHKPVTPIIIHTAYQQQPAFTILRNIGYQARQQADIHLHVDRKTIELRYRQQHD